MTHELIAHYTAGDEAGRLGRDRDWVEWQRTQDLLTAYLPPAPARIADIGGGPGRYANQLAGRGYSVVLFDVVPAHVDAARAHGVVAAVADARAVPLLDASVDAALLLGPLYHLPAVGDRVRALIEARRILRPGGPVVVAALSRVGRTLVTAVAGLAEAERRDHILQVLETAPPEPRRHGNGSSTDTPPPSWAANS